MAAMMKLSNQYHVTLVARGLHGEKIKKEGLTLITDSHDDKRETKTRLVWMDEVAYHLADIPHGETFDIVVLAVKANQLRPIAVDAHFPRLITKATAIVTIQNGLPFYLFLQGKNGPLEGRRLTSVDPDGALERAFPPTQIVGCVALPASRIVSPGVIEHENGWAFPMDGFLRDKSAIVKRVFETSGFTVKLNPDFDVELWTKVLGSAIFNPVCAITGATLRQLATSEFRTTCAMGMEEVRAIAEFAMGRPLGVSNEQRLRGAARVGDHKPSMLQDVEAGRTDIELAGIVSTVIEIGSWRGSRGTGSSPPPPVLFTIQELTKLKILVMQEEQQQAKKEKQSSKL